MPGISDISIDRQVRGAERELALRKAKYPKMVKSGELSPVTAEEEIAVQAAIVSTLRELRDQANGQGRLAV